MKHSLLHSQISLKILFIRKCSPHLPYTVMILIFIFTYRLIQHLVHIRYLKIFLNSLMDGSRNGLIGKGKVKI